VLLAAAVGGCSGKAVIDDSSSGDATSTPTTTSTATTTTTSGNSCDDLETALLAWLAAAQACDPMINALQCTGDTVVYDTCGCAVVAADPQESEAAEARDAYDEWVDAGCGPHLCADCPPPPTQPWFCDPDLMSCAAGAGTPAP